MTDIAKIIAGLTDAQRRGLQGVRQAYGGKYMVNSSSSQMTRDSLERLGLITHSEIFSLHMHLTPLGLAVRAELEKNDDQ